MSRYVERVIDMLPKLSAEEVKRVLLEVVNENSMLDSFIESFSTGLILVDKKWHILQINKAAKRILRISFDDEKNEDELLFNVIEENEEISDWLKNIADSQKTNVREEFSTSCSDGSVRFLAVSVFSFIQKTEISGSIVKIEDITQLKAKAVLDRRLENMEGLTNLAVGMAHEIKNPLGAIKAFKSAFSHDDDKVGLVVKINHGSREDIAFLQQELKDYHNIFFITHTMDKTEVNSLIADADVFVSLHRAEGFGLVMAEAMLNGTACIATDYSSNTEFMDAETACMVDYKLIELTGDTGFYPKGSKWAEPDYDQAAEYMRRLLKEPEFYSEITKRAKVSIEKKMQMKAVQKTYAQRLEEIYAINRC